MFSADLIQIAGALKNMLKRHSQKIAAEVNK